MRSAAITLAAAVFAVPAFVAAEDDLLPEDEEFRFQEISRIKGEDDWPFVADRGHLSCVEDMEQRVVFFMPLTASGDIEDAIALDYDMMVFALANMGRKSALRPFESFEQLFKRLAPLISMGQRLCDQPPGTNLPDSAL